MPTQGGAPPPDPGQIPADARTWAMLCHLTALTGLLGNIVGFVIGPLVCWLVKKDVYPFVDDQGKEALNFQITMFLIALVCVATCVGAFLAWGVCLVDIVFTIIAALKANEGVAYRYPFAIRFIK